MCRNSCTVDIKIEIFGFLGAMERKCFALQLWVYSSRIFSMLMLSQCTTISCTCVPWETDYTVLCQVQRTAPYTTTLKSSSQRILKKTMDVWCIIKQQRQLFGISTQVLFFCLQTCQLYAALLQRFVAKKAICWLVEVSSRSWNTSLATWS